MKARTIILVIFILLVAGFVALNVETILQPSTLNFGLTEFEAPMGLFMLGLVGVSLVLFLLLQLYHQALHMIEIKRLTKEASDQRQLADKAEASRFTELRTYLQTELQAIADRERDIADKLHARVDLLQTNLEQVMEQTSNGLSASIGELEDRVERRLPPPESDAL